MAARVEQLLREKGIQPSAQRLAVGEVVLFDDTHPTADDVFARARAGFPWLSRATVYNTLNLFVRSGLLRTFQLGQGAAVYDPKLEPHHHFIDDVSGEIHDLPWEQVLVEARVPFRVSGVEVVVRGTRKQKKR
jgi:Fur family iron response transcriptional regulator